MMFSKIVPLCWTVGCKSSLKTNIASQGYNLRCTEKIMCGKIYSFFFRTQTNRLLAHSRFDYKLIRFHTYTSKIVPVL